MTKNKRYLVSQLIEMRNKELNKIKRIKRSLYEDWKNEDITREEYIEMKEEYVKQEEQLVEIIKSLEIEKERLESQTYDCGNYIEAFKKYENITQLSREVLTHLVDVILIHNDGSLTLKFRFADEFKQISEYIEENRKRIIPLKKDKNYANA